MSLSCRPGQTHLSTALWAGRRAAIASMAIVGLLLAGCQAPAPVAREPVPSLSDELVMKSPADVQQPPASEAPSAPDPLQRVLTQTDRIVGLAAPELSKEVTRLSAVEDAAPENPLLLAIALSHTRQAVDTARALGLVQRVLANDTTEEAQALHPLARLVEARLLQQRRLEDQVEKQSQQLRDAQRRNDQLNERLEAVRAIERSLTARPVPPPLAPGGTQRPAR